MHGGMEPRVDAGDPGDAIANCPIPSGPDEGMEHHAELQPMMNKYFSSSSLAAPLPFLPLSTAVQAVGQHDQLTLKPEEADEYIHVPAGMQQAAAGMQQAAAAEQQAEAFLRTVSGAFANAV